MKPGPLRAALLAFVDFIKLAFIGLLAYLSLTITERMHLQRMTVFDLPMSYVYGGVAFGCIFMFVRQAINIWRNARDRLEQAGRRHASNRGRLKVVTMLVMALIFIAVLLAGVPVFIALAGASFIYTHFIAGMPDFVILHRMAGGIDSFPLLAVPFFILAGNLMNSAGITNRIYDFAVALAGWTRGGLAHVNIIGSVIFAGMSGTAIADAAGLGTIEIKAMKDHGYSTEFAVGVTAASSTLGPIIPPSLPFVIYGMMGNVSIGALFLGGVDPGRRDDAVHDGLCLLLRAQIQHGPRSGVPLEDAGADLHRGVSGAAHARDHHRRHDVRLVHADRSRDRGLRLGHDPRHLPLSLDVAEAVLQGHDGHDRDHGWASCSSSPRPRCLAGC